MVASCASWVASSVLSVSKACGRRPYRLSAPIASPRTISGVACTVEDLAALYRWQPITDKSVMMHARNAAYMVGVLPESLHDPLLPEAVRDACLESFFANVRLLAEFLVKSGGPNPRDFTAWDLA